MVSLEGEAGVGVPWEGTLCLTSGVSSICRASKVVLGPQVRLGPQVLW